MDRINGADTIDIGGGRRGFRDENLVAGAAGTEVTALWLNMIQEEILKVITEAGLVPTSGDWTQLWQALQSLGLAPDRARRWLGVNSMTLSSAPGTPSVGDAYLVPVGATGIWAGNVGKIALWSGSTWTYITPTDSHGISLPDGRVFERVAGTYVEKLALDAQSGKWSYALAGGTANALTAALNPTPQVFTVGMVLVLKITATNTADAPTLNVNGYGAATIKRASGQVAAAGDLPVNSFVSFVWDGASWRIVGTSPSNVVPKNVQIFNVTGTTNFVVPDGVFSVYAEVYGGGGGAGVQDWNTGLAHGEGGGGGGFAGGWVSVTPGQVIPVTVGARGVGSGVGSGTGGGTSSFGSFMSATGGTPGLSNGAPGGGGIGVGGQINLSGAQGFDGTGQDPYAFAFGGDAAGPHGGKGAKAVSAQATWPGGGGGLGAPAGAGEPERGGVIVRW